MTDISVIALSHGLEKNHMMQDYQSNRPSGSNRRDIRAQAALSALIGGKTVMVIAHRMRTVVQADKFIVLDRVMRCPLIRAGYQYRFNDRSKKNIG